MVGTIVAVVATATGDAMCGAGDQGKACLDLVTTLALRVGLVAGAAVVLMLVLVIGLLKMVVHDEERREVSNEAASDWGEPW